MSITPLIRGASAPLAVVAALAVAAAMCGPSAAQEPARKYKFEKKGQDLSRVDYSGQDLSETTFQNSVFFLTNFRSAILQQCSFQGADFSSATLNDADLTDSDLRGATFKNASLQGAKLTRVNLFGTSLADCSLMFARFDGADLRNTRGYGDVTRANFSGADLRGANLSQATTSNEPPRFAGAKYDRRTRWPAGTDPATTGAELVEEPAVVETPKPAAPTIPTNPSPAPNPGTTPMPTPGIPAAAADDPAKQFAALDLNADGVLSGKEARPYVDFDANKDGDVTKEEFIAGRSKPAKP